MRRLNSRNLVQSLVIGASLLVAGCSGDGQSGSSGSNDSTTAMTPGPKDGGTIIRRIASECKTLNWMLCTTSYEDFVMRHLYDPLIEIDEHMNYMPVLAESWDISDDHLRIKVTLRENIVWHDGVPITSKDIKFTMDKVLDPAIPALNKEGYFNKLDYLEVVDDRTVVFVWKERYSPALYAVTQLWPMPEHIYGEGDFLRHPNNRAPIGSGAFKFEEWRTSQYISLIRSENYHGKKAHVDRIIFKVIEDDAVALNALKTGELDEMRTTQIQWERQTNDDDFMSKFNKYHYYIPSYNYIGWNSRSVWFSDRRVRLAMTLLFDRQSINSKIYSGFAKLVSGPFYINSWAYDRSIKPHPFDPAAAMTLLDEAGWKDTDGDGLRDKDGVKFEFEFIITSGSNTANQFAVLLQEECRKAGINVLIRVLEGATFFAKIDKGEFDACVLGWVLDLDPDVYDTFHSSQVPPVGLNHTYYSNAQVDSLLVLGRAEFDQEKRAKIYHAIHKIMHYDPPYTFVNTVPEKRPISNRIHNVVISPRGPFTYWPGANYWYIDEDSASTTTNR